MTQLEQLPARIDNLASQIQQLRTDMRDEFSAQGTYIRVLHEEVLARIALTHEGRPAQPRKLRKK